MSLDPVLGLTPGSPPVSSRAEAKGENAVVDAVFKQAQQQEQPSPGKSLGERITETSLLSMNVEDLKAEKARISSLAGENAVSCEKQLKLLTALIEIKEAKELICQKGFCPKEPDTASLVIKLLEFSQVVEANSEDQEISQVVTTDLENIFDVISALNPKERLSFLREFLRLGNNLTTVLLSARLNEKIAELLEATFNIDEFLSTIEVADVIKDLCEIIVPEKNAIPMNTGLVVQYIKGILAEILSKNRAGDILDQLQEKDLKIVCESLEKYTCIDFLASGLKDIALKGMKSAPQLLTKISQIAKQVKEIHPDGYAFFWEKLKHIVFSNNISYVSSEKDAIFSSENLSVFSTIANLNISSYAFCKILIEEHLKQYDMSTQGLSSKDLARKFKKIVAMAKEFQKLDTEIYPKLFEKGVFGKFVNVLGGVRTLDPKIRVALFTELLNGESKLSDEEWKTLSEIIKSESNLVPCLLSFLEEAIRAFIEVNTNESMESVRCFCVKEEIFMNIFEKIVLSILEPLKSKTSLQARKEFYEKSASLARCISNQGILENLLKIIEQSKNEQDIGEVKDAYDTAMAAIKVSLRAGAAQAVHGRYVLTSRLSFGSRLLSKIGLLGNVSNEKTKQACESVIQNLEKALTVNDMDNSVLQKEIERMSKDKRFMGILQANPKLKFRFNEIKKVLSQPSEKTEVDYDVQAFRADVGRIGIFAGDMIGSCV